MEMKNSELERLSKLYKGNLDSAGVTFIQGRGKVTGPHSVEVNGKEYKVCSSQQGLNKVATQHELSDSASFLTKITSFHGLSLHQAALLAISANFLRIKCADLHLAHFGSHSILVQTYRIENCQGVSKENEIL